MVKVRALNLRSSRSDPTAGTTAGPPDGSRHAPQPAQDVDHAGRLLSSNLRLLLIGPFAAGILAFAVVSFLPPSYTSVAHLDLDEAGAQAADARMRSIPVVDRVLSRYDAPGTTVEARRRYIERNTRIMIAPGASRKTARLYRMEYSDRSPTIARRVNELLLDAWLESTKPGPEERAASNAEIQRLDARAKAAANIISELESDASDHSLRSMRGALVEMIVSLSIRQEETLAKLARLRKPMSGVTRDVIIGEPSLPEEASWPNRAVIVILTVAATGLLLAIFVALRPGLRTYAWRFPGAPANPSSLNP